MAHYAFLDSNNVVTEVIVGRDETEGVDWESHYAELRSQRCLRTSYNTRCGVHLGGGVPFRGNFAGVTYLYIEEIDAFVPPCPGEGFTLDPKTFTWVNPSQQNT